jgi:hypothetical protein
MDIDQQPGAQRLDTPVDFLRVMRQVRSLCGCSAFLLQN